MRTVFYRPPGKEKEHVMAFVEWSAANCRLLRVPIVEIDGFTYSDLLVLANDDDFDGIFQDFPGGRDFNLERRELQRTKAVAEDRT
jgi:hypothetical protein